MRVDDLLEAFPVLAIREHPREARTIQRAAHRGLLAPILPGVYVAPRSLEDPLTRLLAVTAWSPHGAVSGRTAVELLGGSAVSVPIQLRSPNRSAPVAWLEVARGRVPLAHRRTLRGIGTVSPEYACLEVAVHDRGEAAFEFLRRRLVTPDGLARCLPAFAHRPGNPVRRTVAHRAITNPWSFAEARLHDLLEGAGIEGWVANRPLRVEGVLLFPDLWFRGQRLVVEFDGEAVHSTHDQFEHDRLRQNLMVTAGIRVLRFTWLVLTERPELVVRTILRALGLS